MWSLIKQRGELGEIRKMVAMDGHNGPQAIKVQAEFLDWLRDPVRNGGGALYDFGCYGANLMTWMMDKSTADRGVGDDPAASAGDLSQGRRRSDDRRRVPEGAGDYPGVVELADRRKDFEVYGQRGWAIATGGTSLRVAMPKRRITSCRSIRSNRISGTRSRTSSRWCGAPRSPIRCRRSRQHDCHRDSRGRPRIGACRPARRLDAIVPWTRPRYRGKEPVS